MGLTRGHKRPRTTTEELNEPPRRRLRSHGPAYRRYVNQLNASDAGFMKTLPQGDDYTGTVIDVVSCTVSMASVTASNEDDAWQAEASS
ncbi:hypothetical protein SPRG_11999 [Saprolegnia parasitica CBS 223.65]|uniref:Uncharacterized protein n=1 Tax=Saprolegnia parasitica (strain CBS 223.65) TaxID=695850 RepID=A0A067C7S2_SAPPC|nr:hypothetical protein SPRG_11999 [Saprolegnia parasitica CBS 223.65]KDO22862.1 hypothetical protein SPRG_11999 [Saprolegnia parasitica CBS 223.65]|eukprot:XP_012206419.1 hypothetical protein SPRG_11999 [Saprolegnia parasitica CBS 223.65]